jgi:formylglycine-generating enzyme required for sulfatase activity
MEYRLLNNLAIAWILALLLSTLNVVYLREMSTRCPSIRAINISRTRDAPLTKQYVAEMTPIPGGQFLMGSNRHVNSRPVHLKSIKGFLMGRTPVTVGMWKEYCSATNRPMPEPPVWGWLDDHPVVNVSWDDIHGDSANDFCAWVSRVTGLYVTLPSEAQWEYAARGGYEGKVFPWGNEFDDSQLWSSMAKDRDTTAPVNRQHNRYMNFGVSDLYGNVFQWCLDEDCSYSGTSRTFPPYSDLPKRYIYRGSAFCRDDIATAHVGNRFIKSSWRWENDLGFRLVVNVDNQRPRTDL